MKTKGLGANQRAILKALASGEMLTTSDLSPLIESGETDGARAACRGLQKRGFNIEFGRIGSGREIQNTYRLLPYPDIPWLPVEMIPDYYRLTAQGEFTSDEARRIIEDHLAVMKRRAA